MCPFIEQDKIPHSLENSYWQEKKKSTQCTMFRGMGNEMHSVQMAKVWVHSVLQRAQTTMVQSMS